MNPIVNYQYYDSEMAKAIMDKLFFLDKVDADVFVDYGCADGLLINKMVGLLPGHHEFLGYDFDQQMINQAMINNIKLPNTYFTTDLEDIKARVAKFQKEGLKVALVLSSVIHEIYSYQTVKEVDKFWEFVFETGFDYVIIRDMAFDTNISVAFKFKSFIHQRIEQLIEPEYIEDFTKIWGPIEDNPKNIIHFLLKYRYRHRENWKREVAENYLPLADKDYFNLGSYGYNLKVVDFYRHPFITKKIIEDFELEQEYERFLPRTHIKMIFEKIK